MEDEGARSKPGVRSDEGSEAAESRVKEWGVRGLGSAR